MAGENEAAAPEAAGDTSTEAASTEQAEYTHPSGSLASNADESFEDNVEDSGDAAAATGEQEIPGAVPSTISATPEAQAAPMQQQPQPQQEWVQTLLQQQQQMFQQQFKAYQDQQQLIQNMVQQAAAKRAQAEMEASKPQPPAAGAPLEDWFKYQHSMLRWEMDQEKATTSNVVSGLQSKLDQAMQAVRAQQELANRQAQEALFQQKMMAMARQPDLAWVNHADPKVTSSRQAVLKTIHEVLSSRGHNLSIEDTARMLADAFTLNGPTQKDRAVAQRTTATTALKQEREKIASRGGPIPASAGGKANVAKGGARARMEKYQKLGVKYPTELKALYEKH